MITLKRFRDNPLAPTMLVSDVGGIYRVNSHLIRCTFVDDVPNAEGVLETVAQGHLVWKTEQNWLASGKTFRLIMSEFQRGLMGINPRMQ